MKTTQRGQALVLIALAIVGLVGFAALAIDGSNVFSDRRHSQNASDTAAYAAALALARAEANWKDFGMDRAISNGYDPADGISEVDVHLCSELPLKVNEYTLTCKGLPTGADPTRYVHVHIKSVVDLFFAPVIGWRQITNHTDAVVLAAEQEDTSFFPGYAIVSTMLGCPSYNHDPFKVTGSSSTTIINAGILVNSDCTSPQPAYDQGGNASSVVTDTGVCVAGEADYTHTSPPPTEGCSPIDYSLYTLPNPGCAGYPDGDINPHPKGGYIASPGRYGSSFDYESIVDINPNDKVRLQKGIYCFYDGLSLNAQWNLTTDWNDSGLHDSNTEGVLFFVADGDITFNGSSDINLHAVDSTYQGFPEQFVNLLIYVPPTNPNDVYITGGSGSEYTGTILAPASYIRLNGGSESIGLNSQIIGYAVAIEGNGTLDINYQADDNATTTYNPSLTGIE
jgi:Flp pilus assembly protein TadG